MKTTRTLAGIVVFVGLAIAQPGGALEGKVLNSATGQPVVGAAVVLQGLDATGSPPQPDSYVVDTDANGGFRVEEIAAGRYEGRAERDGFTAKLSRFTVEPGQRVRDGILMLIPLGVISGRVADTDGDPVAGAIVAALRYSYATGKKELKELARGFSNDRGDFRIANLPPGRYYLMFSPGPFTRSTLSGMKLLGPKPAYEFANTYYPAAVDVAAAVSLDLPPGGELRDKTILVRPDQTYTIRITIAGPIADSAPTLGLSSPNGMGLMMTTKYGATRPFPNSPPGTYMVHGEDRARMLSARQAVKVVNSDVDVSLTLRPEIVLSGTVGMEGGGKLAVDGVRVSLEGGEIWGKSEAAVKPDGTFALRNVQPVNYQIRVSVPAGGYLKSVRLGERTLAAPEIDMARAGGPLVITVGTGGGKLEGVAAEGATVVAVPAGRLGDWPELVRSAVAGKDGKFELRDLAPGDYQVFAWEDAEPGAPLDPDFRKPFEKQATMVRVAANGHETVQLKVLSEADAK